jgi:hypothetical protein
VDERDDVRANKRKRLDFADLAEGGAGQFVFDHDRACRGRSA